jgi:hypothetical protein
MEDPHRARIKDVTRLLEDICHVAIATVNKDGSPHNTPVFAGIDDTLRIFWASHPASIHSQNIDRRKRAYIVLFDSFNKGAGLYIDATTQKVPPEMFDEGLKIFNDMRAKRGRDIVAKDKFSDAIQALYYAEPIKLWVNAVERNQEGNVIRDYRFEVSPKDLQNSSLIRSNT